MACVALTSLMATIELEFLQPTPRVSLHHHDEAPIKSFFHTLSSLQAFLQKESSSSGDDDDGGGALRDLEIQIRDFALKAEDNIEIQLSNFLLAKDTEHREKASQGLLQIMGEEAENAADLLKIITREKDSCVSEREMACAALTSLISTIQLQFLQRTPRVSLHRDDKARIKSFFESLSPLQDFLQKKSSGGGARVVKDLEIQIRDFAVKTEDDIEMQLSNILPKKKNILGQLNDYMFFWASHGKYQEKAYPELRQTMREAIESATELLKIISKEKEREITCNALTSLRATIDKGMKFWQPISTVFDLSKSLFKCLSSLHFRLREESSGGVVTTKVLKTKIIDFALKAEDIQIQLTNFFQAKYRKSQQDAHWGLGNDLEGARRNAIGLLETITTEKKHHKSERKKASDTLNIFVKKFHFDFLHHPPIVLLDDKAAMISLFEKLSSLQDLLQNESSDGAAINVFKTEIGEFVLKAEDDIEEQIKNVIQARDNIEYQEKAFQLNQAMQEAAENAEKLLMIEKECDDEIEKACVALSSLMGTIQRGFHDDEAVRESFPENISFLQAFLEKESGGGAAVKDLETKIKDFALKTTDDIEMQLNNSLQDRYTEYEENVPNELHQTMREAAKSAAELLKIINSSNNEVDEANESQPSSTWLRHASKSANVESDGSLQGFLKLAGRMVGRDHDCRVIKDKLLSSDRPREISIVGMSGIGKTMLAKNVYEDPSVALHFDVRCWITIPQDYNKSRMLRDLLQSITPSEPNAIKKGSTPDELEMQVCKCLLGRRFLIVFDNIMSNQACIDIKKCFPIAYIRGSCILLTTTFIIGDERRYNGSDYIHHLSLLDPKASWELFCNILPIKEHMATEFEKIKNHVVEKCDGLPQLIVEVAKRLSKCNNIQQGWKKIEKELESLGILDRYALMVSYNMLSHHLKVCFLYFGVFPKRKRILVKMLIRLWIAEGFVKPSALKELEDVAYGYLLELIDRSLLLIEDRSSEGKIKTCRLHSALHSFCVGEAQKEGILCAVNTQQHSGLSLDTFTNSCRWLSLYSHSFDYYVLFGTNIPRSIFFFYENPEMFVPLKLLRVLAFDTSIFLQRVPLPVGDLVFLRCLSITQWFEDLDHVVSNNLNLQTLIVCGNGALTVHLPSSIWKLPQLRILELGNSYAVDPPSMVKENLQSLSCVMRPIHCRKEVYDKLPNIKKLNIFLKNDSEASQTCGSCSNPIILDSFDNLKGLEKLIISVSIGVNAALPKQCMFPSKLIKLKLSGINLSWRDLYVIAMLPELKVLKLENALHETVWDVAKRGFRKLRFLLFEDKNLRLWVVSHDRFPVLEHLVLRSCNCLKKISKDFARISTLKSIELKGCHSSLVASAKQFQLDPGSNNIEIKILDPEYDES